MKNDFFLEQGMSTHHQPCLTVFNVMHRLLARLAFLLAGQPCHADAQRREPAIQVSKMLLCQNFSRCHNSYLVTALDRLQGCYCCHNGFAGTDITLHQPHHRMWIFQIIHNLGDHTRLRSGEFKTQLRRELFIQPFALTHYRRAMLSHA